MQILSGEFLESYRQQLKIEISKAMAEIDAIELTSNSFTFYTSVAVISSSRIEGEQMEIDSYVKHKTQNIEYLPELVEKPNDLYNAYLFAKENKLTLKNFLQSHLLLSQHLLLENGEEFTEEMKCCLWNTTQAGYNSNQRHLIL